MKQTIEFILFVRLNVSTNQYNNGCDCLIIKQYIISFTLMLTNTALTATTEI